MKKLIVEEVNLFRSEVRAAARTSQNRQCVSRFCFLPFRRCPHDIIKFFFLLLTAMSGVPRRLTIPSRDDIVASPIRDDAPLDGATSGYYSGHTPQQGVTGGRRPPSPVIDDPSAELERELAGTHIGRK